MDIPEQDRAAATLSHFDKHHLNPARNCTMHPFLSGAVSISQAFALRAEFGEDAAHAAALRSAHSRVRDNPYSYCQWREVERLMDWLDTPDATASRH